ncbi:MAG: response regulator, partial [Pseudomonadota bacterium]
AVSLIMLDAQSKGMIIDVDIAPNLPDAVTIDGGRVQQILMNLLSNAVRYSQGTRIAIRVTIDDETTSDDQVPDILHKSRAASGQSFKTLRLSVSDNGVGITETNKATLFDAFTQFDGAKPGSSGLGLAICRSLCREMGGDIAVDSTEGVGSAFRVSMVAGVAQVAPQNASPDAGGPIRLESSEATGRWLLLGKQEESALAQHADMGAHKPLSVLLADDYEVNRLVQHAQLEKLGYRADTVANGEEAVRAVTEREYDIVLMDMKMPILDGVAATERIRAMTDRPQPYIVAVTASVLKDDAERFEAAGMDAYVSKPVDPAELVDVLDKAYRRKTSVQGSSESSAPSSDDLPTVEIDFSSFFQLEEGR